MVLQAADLWMLHLLQIELDQFQADGADGAQPQESLRPGQHVCNSAFQRGWQPPVISVADWQTGACGSAFCAVCCPDERPDAGPRAFLMASAPMYQFRREDHFSRRIIDQGQSTRLAPWINLQAERMHLWLLDGHFENDREGIAFEDSRFPLRQQDACSSQDEPDQVVAVSVSKTKTLLMTEPLLSEVMVASTMFRNGLACNTLL